MIRTEQEHRAALVRLEQEDARITEHRKALRREGLSASEVKRVMDPLVGFRDQLAEEIDAYERLRRGEFGALPNLRGLGSLLVGLRIASGLTQRELASRLGVHESQVSRDERNEYHNLTLERASRILDALGVELRTVVERTGLPAA